MKCVYTAAATGFSALIRHLHVCVCLCLAACLLCVVVGFFSSWRDNGSQDLFLCVFPIKSPKQQAASLSRWRMEALPSHSSHCSSINLQRGTFKSHATTLAAKKVDVWSHISFCSHSYLYVNVLGVYTRLFHSNQHTELTKSGVWTFPYLIPRKLFINWNSLRNVQLNQLANPSSLWAAGTGRRATNHPLSFHLCGLVSCPTQLTQEPPVDRNSWWWFALYAQAGYDSTHTQHTGDLGSNTSWRSRLSFDLDLFKVSLIET